MTLCDILDAMDKISAIKMRNPNVLIQAIGQRLRKQRLAKGWTQQDLANRAGISVSTLKLLEHEGKGSLQRLAKLAVALDIDGELRFLFADQTNYNSLEDVERMGRQRAPRQPQRAN